MAAPTETYVDPSIQDRTAVTITNVTTTATVTQAGHGYSNSDTVKVYGANEANYNGLFTISNVSTDNYDYTMGGDPGGSATGSPTASKVNLGAGTVGDPYADVQQSLNTVTRDTTNGDRFNILAGTDEILAANLSYATYGSSSNAAPLILQGYTSVAGDGGIGGISGNGSYNVGSPGDGFTIVDMHIHNSGSATVLTFSNYNAAVNVEIDNTTGTGISTGAYNTLVACYVHNCGGTGISLGTGSQAIMCTAENGTNDFSTAIQGGTGSGVFGCVVNVDGTTDGIVSGHGFRCVNNTVFSNGGSGQGIIQQSFLGVVINNVVEGFSNTGGIGVQKSGTNNSPIIANNAVFNCTTPYSMTAGEQVIETNNETLTASPFLDAANGDFRVNPTVVASAYPTVNYNGLAVRTYLDKGALQRAEAGARIWSATFEEVSVSAAQDLFELVAPSDRNIIIHGFVLSQSSTTTSEELSILVHRGSTSGSGGTTATPSPINAVSGNFPGVVEMNNTSQSTEGNILHATTFNVVDGISWFPVPELRPVVSPGERIIVELQTAPGAALTMSGTLYFEEMGG